MRYQEVESNNGKDVREGSSRKEEGEYDQGRNSERRQVNNSKGTLEEKEDILPPESSQLVVDGVADIPDGGYGWVICFTCFFCAIVVDGIPTGIFTRS